MRTALLALAAVAALAAGWGAGRYFGTEPARPAAGGGSGAPPPGEAAAGGGAGTAGATAPAPGPAVLHRLRPDFSLPDLDGRLRGPEEWEGKVLVLNFWATWCAPCREEIPLLMALEEGRPGVAVVGVALDTPEAVRAFARELGIGYPIVFDDARGSTMRRYGNRVGALPFTAVVDRSGIVAYVRLGIVDPGELGRILDALS